MHNLTDIVGYILNIDEFLGAIINSYGVETYIFLFLIIFSETGFVIFPFLPSDTLIFTSGTFAAIDALNINVLYVITLIAALLGDTVNYNIGKIFSNKVEILEKRKIISKKNLDKAQNFFRHHGGNSILVARFIPMLRTFAPFISGISKMKYIHFLKYNILGNIIWVTLFLLGGYFLGNIEIIKSHLSITILIIVGFSFIPMIVTYIINKLNKNNLSE